MSIEGVDYAWGRPRPSELARLGKQFACRYLSYDTGGKNLTKAEADALHAAGVATVANWEWNATDAKGGYSAGVKHATEAKRQALACGMPPGRPIYFSADWNMTTADFPVVSEYFRGVRSVLGLAGTGIYGGYRAVAQAANQGWASWFWQTFAWSNSLWHPAAHIQQYQNGVRVDGVDSDLDRSMKPDFGQWGGAFTMADLTPQNLDDIAHAVWDYAWTPDGQAKAWSRLRDLGADAASILAAVQALQSATPQTSAPIDYDKLAAALLRTIAASPVS